MWYSKDGNSWNDIGYDVKDIKNNYLELKNTILTGMFTLAPHKTFINVKISLTVPEGHDVFNLLTGNFIHKNVKKIKEFTLLPDEVAVITIIPKNSLIKLKKNKIFINDKLSGCFRN